MIDSRSDYSFLGINSSLNGNLEFSGPTSISCKINGTITIKDDSNLIIQKSAFIEGDLFGNDIEIFGNFQGTINAIGTLTIRPNANVSGKLVAKNLCIYPGANVNMEGHTNESLL